MDSIQLTLTFNNSPWQLWEAWTNPFVLAQWFGSDPAGTVTAAIMDVREGGEYSITFRDSDGTEHTCAGVYTNVYPTEALSFSWEWKSEPGHITQIEIAFIAQGQQTVMKFVHAYLGTHSTHQYEAGWNSTFQKLTHVLNKM